MKSATLEVWIEFASTYSHVAVLRLDAAIADQPVRVEWRPFLLGPIFGQQGWNDSPFNIYPAKGAYMWRDMERLCEKHAIPFRRPERFPQHSLLAARVATAAEAEPWLGAFIRSVYVANFADGAEISEPRCLRARLASAGCPDPDAVLDRAQSDAVKARLRERTAEAVRLGLFGAPSFVANGEVFWGQDRLEDAIAWCLRD